MTEDEAKTKWCPFVRLMSFSAKTDTVTPACNRLATDGNPLLNPPAARCIASECMAWRWVTGPGDPKPNKARIYVPDGHCGLAGNP